MKLELVYVIKMDVTLSFMHRFKTIQFFLLITQVQTLSEISDIIDKMELEQDLTTLWGGDFNLFFDSFLDADGRKPQLKMNYLNKLLSIMSERDLCDLFRVRHPDTRRFTWRHKNSFLQRRLHYFLDSDDSQDQIDTFDIIPSVQSDH